MGGGYFRSIFYHRYQREGEYTPTLLGSIPDMDSDSAIEALESAKKAFNRGQGKWPTMKVRDRLKCMKRFADKMQDHRDIVVKLLMWEIGKNQTDSEKEFDRTVKYIYDTIDEYKNIDRSSLDLKKTLEFMLTLEEALLE